MTPLVKPIKDESTPDGSPALASRAVSHIVGVCGDFVGKAPQITLLISIFCVRPEGFEASPRPHNQCGSQQFIGF
jgi:hypothetical protein